MKYCLSRRKSFFSGSTSIIGIDFFSTENEFGVEDSDDEEEEIELDDLVLFERKLESFG